MLANSYLPIPSCPDGSFSEPSYANDNNNFNTNIQNRSNNRYRQQQSQQQAILGSNNGSGRFDTTSLTNHHHVLPTTTSLSPISFLNNSGSYPARATTNDTTEAPGVPYSIDTTTIHHPVFSTNPSPYSSSPSFLSGGTTTIAPSPPTSCPSPISLRYDIILEAPPATAQRSEETQLTYLNKGQYYCISLSDNEQYDGTHTSTLALMFHDESHRRLALNYWRFWLGQQREPENARALEVNHNRCSGIHNVQCDYFDRITFDWHGKRGAKIYIKFNCLSTDFSRIKGVKGIPLRLHMKTQVSTSTEHQVQQQSLVEATYCKIKLFRDKGAERKNKDDQRHIEKQLEKLQGNPEEAHPLLNALRREIKYTAFSDIAEELSSPVMSSVALEQTYSNTTTAERFKSSSLNKSSLFTFSTNTSSPTSTSSSSPPSTSISPGINSPISPRGIKRSAATVSSQDYFCQSQPNPTIRTATYNNNGTSSMSPSTPSSSSTSSSPTYPPHYSMYDTGSSNGPLEVDGIDPNYIPIRRRRHAVLSLFARCPNDEYYRAIYLDELSVQNLIDKLSTKLNVPVPIKNVIRHVSKHDGGEPTQGNVIAVRVDDTMVRDIPEQQDMEVEIKFNDDGFATVILCF
ncbi:hypothetical protein INT45_006323 [Circinella minor]|uniref:Grh/CP2 DB domain-containing protein n=1 Tax=Circinella minor TaxID=1195481 RepID=A0A8H7RYK9_9FUNG|nr:hypothetical protein INT45_006323 [Circinella minor]